MDGTGKNANFPKKLLAFEDAVSIVSPLDFLSGVVAQLEERHNGIVEVRGSRPLGSTTFRNGIRKGAVFVFGTGRDLTGRRVESSSASRVLTEASLCPGPESGYPFIRYP